MSPCSADLCDAAELSGTSECKKSSSEFTSLATVCSLHGFSNDQRAFAPAAASPAQRPEASAVSRWPHRGKLAARVAQSSCSPSRISPWGQRGPRPREGGGDFASPLSDLMIAL